MFLDRSGLNLGLVGLASWWGCGVILAKCITPPVFQSWVKELRPIAVSPALASTFTVGLRPQLSCHVPLFHQIGGLFGSSKRVRDNERGWSMPSKKNRFKGRSSHLRLLCATISIYPVVTFGGSLWATQCLLHCSLYLLCRHLHVRPSDIDLGLVTCFVALIRISSGPSVLIQGLNCHSLRIQRLRTASGPRALASSCWPLASP